MTDGEKRRLAIFKIYAEHLKFLVEYGFLDLKLKYDQTYICPICTEQFSIEALDQKGKNPLTLEDAPPKSLGGKAQVLTCRKCNNTCGTAIDHHLTSRLLELDQKQFIPGVRYNAKFEKEGIKVNGVITVDNDGVMQVEHDETKNNPDLLQKYLKSTVKGEIVNIDFGDSKADNFRLQLALLKSAYLLTFSKFGFSFLLHSEYDRIRDQLRNPEIPIYPEDAWFETDEFSNYYGVHFTIEPGMESVLPIFPLSTELSERSFGVIVPLTTRPIEEIIAAIRKRFDQASRFEVAMDPMSPGDYLFDAEAIAKMLKWIQKLNQVDNVISPQVQLACRNKVARRNQ